MKRIAAAALACVLLLSACAKDKDNDNDRFDRDERDKSPAPSAELTETPEVGNTDAPLVFDSGVKTDFSGLTEYKAKEPMYSRLSDKLLTELFPSRGYGRLLRYGGSIGLYYGYPSVDTYGLVTADGMIVTDPIYTNIVDTGRGVYILQKTVEDPDSYDGYSLESAICGLDGRFVTEFTRGYTTACETVIVIAHHPYDWEHPDALDIDVYDYSGKLLYNMRDLECADLMGEDSLYGLYYENGGYFVAETTDGRVVYINALSGRSTYLEYDSASPFSSGMSCVVKDGLCGAVDTNLEEVIAPQYTYQIDFTGPIASIWQESGEIIVINRKGEVVATTTEWYNVFPYDAAEDAEYYFSSFNPDIGREMYYDKDFNKLPENRIPFYYGGYCEVEDDGVTIYKDGKELFIPDAQSASDYTYNSAGLIAFSQYNDSAYSAQGICTIDGVLLTAENENTYYYISEGKSGTYVLAHEYIGGENMNCTVYNSDGEEIFSAHGAMGLMLVDGTDLFEVVYQDWFEYRDSDGNVVFRYPLSILGID